MTLVLDLFAARRYLVPLERHESASPFYRIAMARTGSVALVPQRGG
jgi:hypothetical protein